MHGSVAHDADVASTLRTDLLAVLCAEAPLPWSAGAGRVFARPRVRSCARACEETLSKVFTK